MYAASDTMSQSVTQQCEHQPACKIDYRRAARTGLSASVLSGALAYFYYAWLDRAVGVPRALSSRLVPGGLAARALLPALPIASKIAIDIGLFEPVYDTLYITLQARTARTARTALEYPACDARWVTLHARAPRGHAPCTYTSPAHPRAAARCNTPHLTWHPTPHLTRHPTPPPTRHPTRHALHAAGAVARRRLGHSGARDTRQGPRHLGQGATLLGATRSRQLLAGARYTPCAHPAHACVHACACMRACIHACSPCTVCA